MKPTPFKYHAPETLEEVLELLEQHGDEAKLLAGGQSLVPTMNFRLAMPAVLIDLNRVPDLATIEEKNGALRIGAMTRQAAVERDATVARISPLLHETMPFIAHPQIRNRGTIGGSLAHADPAAELPALMLAAGAEVTIRGKKGERTVSAAEFFVDLFTTCMEPEEMVTAVTLPALSQNGGTAFKEVARRHGDYALAGVAALVTQDKDGKCTQASIALLSVGSTPMKAQEAESALVGMKLDEAHIAEAAKVAAEKDIDPFEDMHASVAYRRHLAEVLTRQTLTVAAERAAANSRETNAG